jgi:hypothetical protein
MSTNKSRIEVICPYHVSFIDFAKSIKGRWDAKMRLWKFPKSKKNEITIKEKLIEIYGYDGRVLEHTLELIDTNNVEIKKYNSTTIVKGNGFALINYIATEVKSVEQLTDRSQKETFRVTEFFMPDFSIPHFVTSPSKMMFFKTHGIKLKSLKLINLINDNEPQKGDWLENIDHDQEEIESLLSSVDSNHLAYRIYDI